MSHNLIVPLAALSLFLVETPTHAEADITLASPVADGKLNPVCITADQPVDEKGFVRIGGMEQWVRIKGSSCANL